MLWKMSEKRMQEPAPAAGGKSYDSANPPPPGQVYKSNVHWNPEWSGVAPGK